MKAFLKIFVLFIALCYPFAIYFGLGHVSIRYLLLAIACVLFLRFFAIKKHAPSRFLSTAVVVVGLMVCAIGIASNSVMMVKLYPVFINIVLLIFFLHSLFYPPSVIERIARITNPALPTAAIAYTRNVTIVWSVFFVLNGAMALWTVFFASTRIWMLYNGFIAYVLMGLLFAVEYSIRFCVRKKHG